MSKERENDQSREKEKENEQEDENTGDDTPCRRRGVHISFSIIYLHNSRSFYNLIFKINDAY